MVHTTTAHSVTTQTAISYRRKQAKPIFKNMGEAQFHMVESLAIERKETTVSTRNVMTQSMTSHMGYKIFANISEYRHGAWVTGTNR